MNTTNKLQGIAPLLVFVIAFLFYGVSAGTKIDEKSKTPQYTYLAYSFLHGRLDLIELPDSKFDLISYQDKWYIPGGMAPALLLMPVIAIFGLDTSDILFGVVLGALNVAFMFSLLGQLNKEKPLVRNWLTFLFAAGTVHWWVASVGSVWFNALLTAALFMILFVSEVLGQNRSWLAGIWLGLAALARPTTLFSFPFYLLFVLSKDRSRDVVFRKLAPFSMALAGFVAIMLTYNYLRFSNPLEFGYGYVKGSAALTDTYASSGGFSPKYMPCNMFVSLVGLPNLQWSLIPSVNEICSYLSVPPDFGKVSKFFNPLGMSIFLTTPAFLLIFRNRLKDELVIPAFAGMIGVLILLWMYHTTGWTQFGYRYTLDFVVFIFILLSQAIKRIAWLEMILIGSSAIMGYIGLYLMYYLTFGLKWNEMAIKGIRIVLSMVF